MSIMNSQSLGARKNCNTDKLGAKHCSIEDLECNDGSCDMEDKKEMFEKRDCNFGICTYAGLESMNHYYSSRLGRRSVGHFVDLSE